MNAVSEIKVGQGEVDMTVFSLRPAVRFESQIITAMHAMVAHGLVSSSRSYSLALLLDLHYDLDSPGLDVLLGKTGGSNYLNHPALRLRRVGLLCELPVQLRLSVCRALLAC